MFRVDEAGNLGTFGRFGLSEWLKTLEGAVIRGIRLFHPWQDLDRTPDELVAMLMAEFPEANRRSPMVALGELLQRHRQFLSKDVGHSSQGQW